MKEQHDANVKTVVDREPSSVGTGELVINNFKTEMEKCKPGDKIVSKPFKVKENLFVVQVFPNGFDDTSKGNIGVYVANKSRKDVTVDKFKVNCCGEIKEEDNRFFGGRTRWGLGKWLPHDAYKLLTKNEDFMVKAEVTIIGDRITMDKITVPKQKSSSFVLEKLYRREMADSDFVLMCEGEAIPCHKLVLANSCDFFEGLLKPHTKEYQEGSSSLLCSAEVGRNLVKFLYTDEIEETFFNHNIVDFLRLADMLIIDTLKQRTEQRMMQLLNKPNMTAFFIAGADFNAKYIRKEAKKLLQSNMDWFHKQENWKEDFGERKDLLIEVYSDIVQGK